MKKTIKTFSIQFFFLFFGVLVLTASAQTFIVTETDDPAPDGCNSGTDCSLREAIIAANDVSSGTATIQLVGGQTYTLSIVNDDARSTDFDSPDATEGSLKILNTDATVRIEATGSGMATIDANNIDRVFIIYAGTDVEIDEIEITGGSPANGQGGGIFVLNNNNLEITNSSITGNTAIDLENANEYGYGGGIWAEGVMMTVTGTTISNNEAGFQGGGLRIVRYNEEVTVNSDVTIENSTISNNDGGQYGGGIVAERSDLTITESTISGNQVSFVGGGIYISTTTSMDRTITIDRSTVNGNFGGLSGGLDIGGGMALIINSTISGNEADNFNGAGGIYVGNFSDPVVDIVNTTITNNTSGTIGGVINGTGGGVINFSNSIVANQASFADDCLGTINSNGYNLESEETCGFTATGDLQNSDPLLSTLQDNGGPVFTHAITGPLSPAVNAGSNALYTSEGGDLGNDMDANGNDRVYDFGSGGIIDMGAFELQQEGTVVGCPVTNEDNILFVKKGESGTGANWGDALGELRDALALFEDETCTTEDVDEIWVTAGTYLPTDDSGDREATFRMPGVNIRGGFEGDETEEFQRNTESNITILSGDIDENDNENNFDNHSNNSYHVVTSIDEAFGGLFDFRITGGYANGSAPHDKGGGLYASNGGISMADVVFENNYAEATGGGAYVIETEERIGAQHPGFTRTTFRNNETGEDGDGGGLALINAESRIIAVTFENNSADRYGGGLFNNQSDPVLKNVIFRENSSGLEGGGMLNNLSSPELFNVLVTNNGAFVNGGGIVNGTNSSPVFTNVSVSGNDAENGNGGGMYNRNGATPTLRNTIVWENSASGTGNEIWNSSNSSAELSFSLYGNETDDIEEGDGFTPTNSLTSDPSFADSGNDDFSLQSTSPAINTGDPDTEMSDFKIFGPDEIDLAENPRVYNGNVDIIDMGSYEFQGEPNTSDPLASPQLSAPSDDAVDIELPVTLDWNTVEDADSYQIQVVTESGSFDTPDFDDETTNTDIEVTGLSASTEYKWRVRSLTTDDESEWSEVWTFTTADEEEPFEPFITTWEVEAGDLEITIPTAAGQTYNYDVDWGDGNSDTGQTGDASHTYDSADTYTIKITGTFPQIEFFNADDKDKILSVDQWGDIEWASMRKAFQGATKLEIKASDKPDLSNATSMLEMFAGATSVNGGLENWDVSTITSMFSLFDGATSFNGDISGWTVSAATDMIRMFAGATSFNRDIGGWTFKDEGTLLMESMFSGATLFDQDLSGWNTGNVGSMSWMFHDAAAFNQDLGDWDISNVSSMKEMLDGSGLSTENYDATLTGWAAQTVQSEVELGADGLTYCDAEADRQSLITDDGWEILGDDLAESCGEFRPFITTWKTDNPGVTDDQSIRIPMRGNGYNFTVDWGDGNDEIYNTNPGDGVNHNLEHTYDSAGTYTVKISGDFPRIYFNNVMDKEKILTVDQWGDIAWSTMQYSFWGASNLTVPASDAPDLSAVTDMGRMFANAYKFNSDISEWDVSNVTNMSGMFLNAILFNQYIGYDPDSGEGWDVSKVSNMSSMFYNAVKFDQDIGGWNVSSLRNMDEMFRNAEVFNQDISNWNVSGVSSMLGTFWGAVKFNQDIGYDPGEDEGWNVSSVSTMVRMFENAEAFNQDLGGWNISGVSNMQRMLYNSGFSTENYDNTLIGWESQSVQNEIILGASGLTYCSSEAARQALIDDHSWTFMGDSPTEDCGEFRPFITTWKTDNPGVSDDESIRIPMIGNGYDFNVDWGDGNDEDYNTNPGDDVEHFLEHTYASAGTYTVKISGDFPRIFFNNGDSFQPNEDGDHQKIKTIEQWGDIEWSSMEHAFRGAINLTYNATDAPDLSGVTSMAFMFQRTKSFNGNIGGWDVSNVTDMRNLFALADNFNRDLSSWVVSNVTDMSGMFQAEKFNQDISGWDVSNVTTMAFMFAGAEKFNGDLSNWNVSNVTSMKFMFSGADSFNQDISNWNVSEVTHMGGMFYEAEAFSQDISTKTVNAGTPEVYEAWNVSKVDSMETMFNGAISFNKDIRNWNTSNVIQMYGMFRNADSFNQDISGWNVGNVMNMSYVFESADAFNQNLGDWDISNVSSMSGMLDGSGLSTENYDNTLIGWESQSVTDDVELGADGLTYCNGETARQALMDDHNWTFSGDGKASTGCESVEGEDQRILAANSKNYIFSGGHFGVSNTDFSIIIESLPDEGELEYDGDAVEVDDEISIADINNDMFTWDPHSGEYGYNFTSFDFTIVDDNNVESEESYTMTIDLGTATVELSGSEGWRFMSNPSDSDSYNDMFSGITVKMDYPSSQTLYELDQENYEWDPVSSTGDEPGIGTPFIVYVLDDDLPEMVESGTTWNDLDGNYSYSGLDYDSDGTSPNPDNFYLLGNPHPIALDFCQFADENIATAAYFWNPEANGGNGDYIDLNCATPDEVFIAPFQSFWIRTTEANPELEIPMEAYLERKTDGYFKEKSEEELFLITLNIAEENGMFTNRTQILFKDGASEKLDRFDAPKLSAEGLTAHWLSFHSVDKDGRQYAFQGIPFTKLKEEKIRIPLDIQTTEPGRFTLDWSLPETNIFNGSYYLKDNDTGKVIELSESSTYSFEISKDQTIQTKQSEVAKSMKEMIGSGLNTLDSHQNKPEVKPRFELLIAAAGIDGMTELGAIPDNFELAQNYPNPFNPTTVISYQLPVTSEVRLQVYDMLGRQVAELVNGQVAAGRHTINFNASNLSSGIYLYRLQAGSQIMTRKLTVVK